MVLGPDGLSRFEDLRRRDATHKAILYAFDLIEHDGEDLRDRPFLDRKAALARLLRDTKAGILLNEHVAEDGAAVFEHACRLGAEAIVSKRSTEPIDRGRARSGSKSAIPPASRCSASAARRGTGDPSGPPPRPTVFIASRDYKLARSSRSWLLVLVPLHRGLEGHALSLGFASADSAIFSAPNRNVLRLERNLVLAHILILPPVAPTESLLHVWFQNRCLVSSGKVAELQE